ncbi:MAG: HD-GYP domain-containing protein, partial [Actinomycetota bacterium]
MKTRRLRGYERLWITYGLGSLAIAGLLAWFEPAPAIATMVVLCGLSALSVRFSVAADDDEKISASAQAMVVAAAVLTFRDSSPLLGPLLVGMCAAFWRLPRTRHQWFTVPGNLGANGLSALAAAAALSMFEVSSQPSALTLAAVGLPVALAYALANAALMAPGIALVEQISLRDAARLLFVSELTSSGAGYVPFLFGAFVGELSLRFGLVVFGLAAATLVMVQAVFASYRKLVESERHTCEGLIAAVERKDPYTAGHSARVARFARYIGGHLGLKGAALARVERHGLMHDIGKLAVPNHVLRKAGPLDDDERLLMLRHEPAGAAILARIPMLADAATVASGREDRAALDGTVRPAHIVHAADAFDAMTSTRAYRLPHTQTAALHEMYDKADKQFHRATVDALSAELDARAELYGAGAEEEVTVYDTPPPKAALGKTLHDGEAAPDDAEIEKPARGRVPHAVALATALGIVAIGAGLLGAATVSLGALVAAGELVCLRPLRRDTRPLSLIPMLVALHALSLPHAIGAIAGGIVLAAIAREHRAIRPFASRCVVAAATIGTYAVVAGPLDATT